MLIVRYSTRGHRYSLELHQTTTTLFDIYEFTHDRRTGSFYNIRGLANAEARLQKIIADSKQIDGINYLKD